MHPYAVALMLAAFTAACTFSLNPPQLTLGPTAGSPSGFCPPGPTTQGRC